jgi:preprotein translocase subunit SecE
MNREQKRMMQRQGTLGPDGAPAVTRRERRTPAPTGQRRGFHPRQFVGEVLLELRKVVRPSRAELVNYATVVFLAVAVLMAFIYALDYLFALGAQHLFR